MTFLAAAKLGDEVVLGKLDYAFYIWSGIVFIAGLALLRKGYIHCGEDRTSELENSSRANYSLFGLISFFIFLVYVPGTLLPSFKIIFTQGETATYITLLTGQILGAITLVTSAYLFPASLRFAPSASFNEPPQLPIQTFCDDIKSGWKSLKFRIIGPVFLILCAISALACMIWRLFYYISEKLGHQLPENIQPLVDIIAKYDWHGPLNPIIILTLGCVIGAPVFEELVFRGMIYPSLKRLLPRSYAIIITGLLFGVVHANFAASFPLIVFGSVLCIIRDRFGLFTCIALHALFNLHTIVWLYLAPKVSTQL